MREKFFYSVYGLQLESALELPELLPGDGSSDVTIKFGAVPGGLDDATVMAFGFESAPNDFLLKVPATANFLVSRGQSITIETVGEQRDEKIRAILLSSVLGALCYQRGKLPFHGSAVSFDGCATLFLENSNCSASTFAALCCDNGYRLVSDNLTVLSYRDVAMALPARPEIELWKDTLGVLGENCGSMKRVGTGLEKFSKKLPHKFSLKPVPVSKIYLLGSGNAEGVYESEITPREAMQSLLECAYHTDFFGSPKKKMQHFRLCAVLAGNIPIKKLHLGNGAAQGRAIADYLKNVGIL